MDFFLQPGMKGLPTFQCDTKHTLQIVEDLNEKIKDGVTTLDGVGVVSMDVENMYNNMTSWNGGMQELFRKQNRWHC